MVYGSLEFNNIIDENGLWIQRPKALQSLSAKYQSIDQQKLYDNIREYFDSMVDSYNFQYPFEHFHSMQNIYENVYPNIVYRRHRFEIKHCRYCISESIIDNGFGHFKTKWLLSNHCDIHDSSLNILGQNSRKKAVNAVLEIIRGSEPDSTNKNRNNKKTEAVKRVIRLSNRNVFNNNSLGPKLMLCAKKSVEGFLNSQKNLEAKFVKNERQMTDDILLTAERYFNLKKSNTAQYTAFSSRNLHTIFITKNYQKQKITEQVIKKKSGICYACIHKKCILNTPIVTFVVDDFLIRQCERDYFSLTTYLFQRTAKMLKRKTVHKLLMKFDNIEKRQLIQNVLKTDERISNLYTKEAYRGYQKGYFLPSIRDWNK